MPRAGDVIAEMHDGEKAVIAEITGGHQLRARLMNMGLRPGKPVKRVGSMPAGGPITVECDGFRIALGRGVCQRVRVERPTGSPDPDDR